MTWGFGCDGSWKVWGVEGTVLEDISSISGCGLGCGGGGCGVGPFFQSAG
jgi:hypothetical protein